MAELGDVSGKKETVAKEWKEMTADDKEKLKEEVDEEMKDYEEELEKWRKKYNVSEDDEKIKRGKSKRNKAK